MKRFISARSHGFEYKVKDLANDIVCIFLYRESVWKRLRTTYIDTLLVQIVFLCYERQKSP